MRVLGFGPRKVMAGILVIGAIPSGLAGTVKSAQGLYVVRFFIGLSLFVLHGNYCYDRPLKESWVVLSYPVKLGLLLFSIKMWSEQVGHRDF